ncbi:MAG: isopeptide-forming domain-containing fimbrial protein, partial [Gammaproteobacteria bacterium]|nr:isopeptide-forming domain-containing fimbrial protein [Gammaproteobacteria bacterium]
MTSGCKSLAAFALGVFSLASWGQTPQLSEGVPDASFLGEQFCFETDFTNSGDPGFGPYVRLELPPELEFDSAAVFGADIGGGVELVGTFPDEAPSELNDPRIDQPVTGAAGHSLRIISFPVGSVVEGAPALPLELCLTIGEDAVVDVPLPIDLTPVYQFGDTPTGDNGPIVGGEVEQTVTPTVILFEKSDDAPESERPPGTTWPYTYTLTADIANTATINPITISDTLPGDFQYDGQGIDITGGQGCSVTTTPPTGTPGGSLEVTCTGDTVGTEDDSDIQVQYSGSIVDTLDEGFCDTAPLQNTAAADATYIDQDAESNDLPEISSDATVTAKHVAVQKGASPGAAKPGETVTYALDLQVTDFGDVSALTLTDTLPDGVAFDDGSVAVEVGGTAVTVTPDVTVDATSGETSVVLDIGSAFFSQNAATQIDAGTAISVSYDAEILQIYRETGEPVRASDSLPNSVDVAYNLVQGGTDCSDGSAAAVGILPVALEKTIVNPQAFYTPGEEVQFRLTLEVPSGDTRDIRFEDFLPLPVFDVDDLDLTFGSGDLQQGPDDTAGLNPSDITIDAAQNALFIDWPDLVSQDDETIQVDLFATVTDDPFADELFLTNILLAETSNTPGQVGVETGPINFQVRAPVLEIDKAVSATTNAGSAIDGEGNLTGADAGDEVTYQITLENTGGADAYNATISDFRPDGLDSCQSPSVTVGGGTRTSTGDLFDAGNPLVIGGVIAAGESAVITYVCTLAADVDPRQVLENEATATWAAGADAPPFPAIRDDASVTVARSAIEKTSTDVDPGPDPNGVVPGDTITYQLSVTLPEGTTPGLTLKDQLPDGFGFVSGSVNVTATGFNGMVSSSPGVSVTGTAGSGQTITLDFGDTTTTGSTGSADNSFLVTYKAEVLDDGANAALNGPQDKTNTASLDFTGNPGAPVTASHDLDFREPNLALTKTFSQGPFQAGEEITITLEVENTGTAPAFDIVVTDVLNEGTDNDLLDLSTVTEVTTPAGYVYQLADGDTVTYTLNSGESLAAGSTVSFTFTARVRDDVVTGSTFENTADVDWDSQDGDVPNQRSGKDDDTAQAEVDSPAVSKTISATSEAWTTGSNLAIGEVVTYRVAYTIPQGQTLSATPAILTDTLPAGQQFLTGTATIQGVYESPDGLTGSTFGPIPTAESEITPELALDGQQLRFDLGDLQNDDFDANDEQIIIRFDALVLNTSANNRGDQKTNTGRLNFLNRSDNPQSQQDTQDITIVEPNLSVDKTADPTSASGGETIEFTTVIGNPNGASSTTRAWELELEDVLPARYQNPSLTSATLSRGNIDLVSCATVSGQTIELDLDLGCLDAGERYLGPDETITLIYTATLDPAVEFEEVVTNTASVQATSLPGNNGTANTTPGDPGGDTGERTGSGDPNDSGQSVNDLAAMNSASVTADRPTVTKTVADDALQIGETTEVRLTIAVPVGKTNAFVLTDSLPAGLEYQGDAEITLPEDDFSATEPTVPAT